MVALPHYPDTVAELLERRAVPESVAQAIREGDRSIRAGDIESARRYYRQALEQKADCYDARAGLEYADYLASDRKSPYQWPIREISPEIHRLRHENYMLNQSEFKQGKTRLESRPPMCFIEPTTKCNFKCPHCLKGYLPYYGVDIEEDLVESAIDQFLPHLSFACITGFGEPTISKRYNAIMAHLARNQVVGHFSTNTSTMTLPHIESLVKCNASVIFSIDGASRKTFETIRLGGNWDRFLHSLHIVNRIRSIYPAPEGILPGSREFRITFVLLRMNLHELPDMIRLVHAFGLDNLTVHDYSPVGGVDFDRQSLRYVPEQANAALDEARAIGKQLGIDLRLPDYYVADVPAPDDGFWTRVWNAIRKGPLLPERKRFPARCYHPWSDVAVKVNGDITPCCFSTRKMGNLREKPFDWIWNGWRYRIFRMRIDSFFPPVECRVCHVTEGISRGNSGATRSKEGFLLKALYYIESRLYDRKQKLRDKNLKANYFKGKSWSPEMDKPSTGPAS